QLFRSQPQGATPQQLQLLQQQQQQQQQQYLAASQVQQQQQQQQQQNFPAAPYTVISGQEPYVGALIAGAPPVVPQYYGVGPWVYSAGLLPQAPPQAAAPPPPRRPLTPSSAAAAAAAAQDTANNIAQTVTNPK
ncbi:TATA-box-binding protein, partial [Orussus abietinus]|uniref:TATA-box-binding protein n=1 Tax=Orussus abietinus TaxID=222816 RepID=UPI000C715E8A